MKVIVKYYGNLDGVRAIDESVKVAELLAQYAVVDIDEKFFDQLRNVPEIIYIEEPKRVYPTDKENVLETEYDKNDIAEDILGNDKIAEKLRIMQNMLPDNELSGKGVIMGIIDSGACVKADDCKKIETEGEDYRDSGISSCRTAAYIRLSRKEGKDSENYSESVYNQQKLIKKYLMDHCMKDEYTKKNYSERAEDSLIYNTYIDDGYSGQNFERPGFKRMIYDIENRKINCVIVKDISRIGRDYIEVGRFIRYYLKNRAVRFISVSDNYDSKYDSDMYQTQVYLQMKSIINDEYSRDISEKVRTQLYINMKKGNYIGAFAPYGYRKSAAYKNKLIPDNDVADVVRTIFKLRAEGYSLNRLAEYLNKRKILTPFENRKKAGEKYKTPFLKENVEHVAGKKKWYAQTVKRILENEIYAGIMAQGKNKKINYKINKTVKTDRDKWIICEKKELAFIDMELYEKANKK